MENMRAKRGKCGTRAENTERTEGDTNSVDVTSKVTKFRKAAGWHCSERTLLQISG